MESATTQLGYLHDRTGRLENRQEYLSFWALLHDRTGRLETIINALAVAFFLHDRTGRLEITN